jgi:Na+/melibiose symporter-like transporter
MGLLYFILGCFLGLLTYALIKFFRMSPEEEKELCKALIEREKNGNSTNNCFL